MTMEKVVFSGVVFQVSWICCLEGSCLKGKFLQDISLASRDRGRAESDRLSTANTHGEIPQMGSWEETMVGGKRMALVGHAEST